MAVNKDKSAKNDSFEYIDRSGQKQVVLVPKNSFTFACFDKTLITYINSQRKNTYGPDCVKPINYSLETNDGRTINILKDYVSAPFGLEIREARIKRIIVELGRK
ncbi:MAG: hypothetical protein AB1765_05685 [Candidatus Hydrogenedentota bacterium]